MAALDQTVTINVGGEKVLQVKPELFSVAGDNKFASLFSERWQNQLDAEGRLFVDYSPQVFVPLIEFLRLVRDSELDDEFVPVVVDPSYRRAWIRMMLASAFHPQILRKAGVTPQELYDCGSDSKLIREAGFTVAQLQVESEHRSLRELVQAGYSIQELQEAGFSAGKLKEAGFAPRELFDSGVAMEELRQAWTPGELVQGGLTLQEMRGAGFSVRQLQEVGFTPRQLLDDGVATSALRDVFTPAQLRPAGVTLRQMWADGFPVWELRSAGFTARELFDVGVAINALGPAGFRPSGLIAMARQLSMEQLGQTEIDSWTLREQLLVLGFNEVQLINAGLGYWSPNVCGAR